MLYSDEVTITEGTTADVFGTAGTITLNAQARRILAIIHSGCDVVYTTAQGSASVLQMVASSLSIADTRFSVGPYLTSGPATNGSGQAMVPEIIPLNISCAGNEVVSFAAASTSTSANGRSHMVQLIYTDNNPAPPQDWLTQFPLILPSKGGYEADAQQLTTARTALTAIQIPSWVKEIIGIKVTVLKNGAITAAQYGQVVLELQSTIAGITPNKWVSNSTGSTLGTPVGTGMYHDRVDYFPCHIPSTGKNETITPYVNLVYAVSSGNQVQVGLLWR